MGFLPNIVRVYLAETKVVMILEPRTRKDRLFLWLVVFLSCILIGFLNFGIIHTNELAEGRMGYDFRKPLLSELTGVFTVFLLLPGILGLWIHLPLVAPFRMRRFPLYLMANVIFGLLHTSLMHVSRELAYGVFQWGEYDYGIMGYRYLMEFHKQVPIFWVVVGILALARHYRQHHEQKLKATQLQEQLATARLDVMRQQVNPHFLFNTLNMISNKVYESPEAADTLITELSELLRASLELGKSQEVKLDREMEFLDKYVHIMRERFGDRFQITQKITAESRNAMVPALLLQPIVENSLKHRLDGDASCVRISIDSQVCNRTLVVSIEDESDAPISDERQPQSTGIGLKNIESRIHSLYGDQCSLQYGKADPNRFRLTLKLPLRSWPGSQVKLDSPNDD